MLKTIFFLLSPFFLVIASDNVNLQNKNIEIKILNEKSVKKTKDDYEKEINLLEKPKGLKEDTKEKEDSLKVDGGVNFNKETKTLESININLGKKF
ncbi:hypothetical protein CP965_08515 [Halarcobacter mediterraneus]|uniref:Uncharacterized protein n=1 Tax=Halarcobacter mediterraneus TaxID=2023153 RepID=A0A4Q1AWW2_9BACT|nr:hypothetical protein [Halarcobacter mediterraneus]RXK12611.1 hypothetical protein CP965_08515 [Halarcobacter mediterraneus]